MMPKITINKDLCVSCGLCVGTRPDIFEFDDDGKTTALVEEIDGELGFECPVGAISVD